MAGKAQDGTVTEMEMTVGDPNEAVSAAVNRPLSTSEQRDMYLKVQEIHDFVATLQNAGLQLASANTPTAIMLRSLIPGLGT